MGNEKDIVLLSSDSDQEEEKTVEPVAKKIKLSEDVPHKHFEKPFMESSSDDSSETLSGDSGSSSGEEGSPGLTREADLNVLPYEENGEAGTKDEVSDELQYYGNYTSDNSSTSASSSSSSLITVPEQSIPKSEEGGVISREVVSETRNFLKTHGTMEFLNKHLPETASSEDLLLLILKLGILPREISKFSEKDNLIELIKILHRAMKRVISMRTRLDDVYSVDHVLDKIKSANRILLITGAGISTSLGIPDFRSSQGFYSQLQNLGLSDPQEVFDLDFFHTDPSIFYLIAYMILPPEKTYTPMHAFIRLLQDKGKLLRNYTQNIDNLEMYAGIEKDKLVQCHGSFATATCVTCKYKVNGEDIFSSIREKVIPYCPKCDKTRKKLLNNDDGYVPESYGVMKPDITFFGESLPLRFHDIIRQDLADCDLLISVGTSLKVAPVASIVESIPPGVPQVLLNRDPIDHCSFDVTLLGYCDDAASYLCNRLGEEWNLEHPLYDKIRGPNGNNLSLVTVDEANRYYEVINSAQGATQSVNTDNPES